MPYQSYSSAQRLSFAGLVVGFIMTAVGAFAPYWRRGNLSVDNITSLFGLDIPGGLGSFKLAEFMGGLFYYCVKIPLEDQECKIYDFDNIKAKEAIMLLLTFVQLALTVLCAGAALCRMCCCGGGKTVCHGVMAFLAGGCGIAVVVLFYITSSDSWELKLKMVEYDWALYVYGAGSALILVVSFILCFASPNNPITGAVLGHMGVSVQQYSRMENNPPVMYPGDPRFNQTPMHSMPAENQY